MTLEWQVSSPPPIFNFDARPDRRRRPLRVRRAGRRARDLQAADRGHGRSRPARRGAPTGAPAVRPPMQDDPGRRQRDDRRRAAARRGARARRRGASRASPRACRRRQPRPGYVIYDDAVFDAAQARVDLRRRVRPLARGSRRSARSATPTRTPRRWTPSREYDPDEIIISTYPEHALGLAAARPARAHRDASGLPVEHVVADIDTEGLAFHVTLAVANRTASGERAARRAQGQGRGRARRAPRPAVHRASCPRRAAAARRRGARARGCRWCSGRLREAGPDGGRA